MDENYITPPMPLREYLADLGRTSGSALALVASEPEAYGRWLSGKLEDKQTPAMGRGSYWHARHLEPKTVSEVFAFYPNRNEATKEEFEIVKGPRGGKKKVATGELIPQDGSPEGRNLSMLKTSDHAKAQRRAFIDGNQGRTFVYPEDQPKVEAMVRAVNAHPEASELLRADGDFAPEVTIHWTCPVTGEHMRSRPDGLRPKEGRWIELKSYDPGKQGRLDTLNPNMVDRFARSGWAWKSATLHDACKLATGRKFEGRWIIVEATADDPRVSVVHDIDDPELDHCMAELGRLGDGESFKGYRQLIRMAQALRRSGDFRAQCVRESVTGWRLPDWRLTRMQFARNANPAPLVTGARVITDGT